MRRKKSKSIMISVFVVGLFLAGGISGWFFASKNQTAKNISSNKNNSLRLGGFTFIKPLLVCDTDPEKTPTELATFERKMKNQSRIFLN